MPIQESAPLWKRSQPDGDLTLVDRRRYFIAPRGCALATGAFLVALGVTALLLFLARESWLAALGNFLIYREAPQPADAIVVLGGGDGARAALGAALYHEGYAPVVVTSEGSEESYVVYQEDTPRARLQRAGVPAAAIHVLHRPLTTYEEAQLALPALTELGAQRILLVTDTFHSRRARDIFLSVLGSAGIEIVTVPSEPDWYRPEAWWRDERSALAVINEYAKYIWFWFGRHGG
ncbi:MAG: hypothetical protein Kow00120_21120 [Anaerolineae bacterium]